MSLWISNKNHRGQLRLLEPTATVCALADTYYKITGTMGDGHTHGFEILENKLKWKGVDNFIFLLTGVSDLRVNKPCEVVYSLFKNGVPVPQAQTPHTFPVLARVSTISITALLSMDYNDEVDVYVKSDTVDTILYIQNLNIVLWGDR